MKNAKKKAKKMKNSLQREEAAQAEKKIKS